MSKSVLLRYMGRKLAIADWVIGHLGGPKAICEPFAGSLAVSLSTGTRPVVTAEVIPVIRDLYNQLSSNPGRLWEELDRQPTQLDKDGYIAHRTDFNARPTPARFIVLNALCYNAVTRFNRSGGFNVPPRDKLDRRTVPTFAGARAEIGELFQGAVCYSDWRTAVAIATGRELPIYADPPYLGVAGYSKPWEAGDLESLARALPLSALVSERTGGEAQAILEGNGFRLIHTWSARNLVNCKSDKGVRAEGIWERARD